MTNSSHNLTLGHCNIQGGLISMNKSNEISQLLKTHNLDYLSLNETNFNDSIDT